MEKKKALDTLQFFLTQSPLQVAFPSLRRLFLTQLYSDKVMPHRRTNHRKGRSRVPALMARAAAESQSVPSLARTFTKQSTVVALMISRTSQSVSKPLEKKGKEKKKKLNH